MIVRDEATLQHVVDKMNQEKIIAFDTETVDRGFPNVSVTGFSVSWADGEGAYIPVGHSTGEFQLPKDLVYDAFRPILEDPEKIVVMQNAGYDIKVASLMDIRIGENVWDTMIASWMVDTEGEHGLKAMTKQIFGYEMTELTDLSPKEPHPVWPKKKVLRTDLVPISELGPYAFDDSVYTRKLYFHFKPMIDKEYKKVFEDLYREYNLALAEIEAYGVYVNKDKLMSIGERIIAEKERARKEVFNLRPGSSKGEEFNTNSTKQLNHVLFTECKIKPIGKKGKSGDYSTKAENLEIWAPQYPIAKELLRYRELEKLYGTFIEGMGRAINPNGRIHARLNIIGTRSGRLSSAQPNLQQLPRNSEFPIRDCFEATPIHLSNTGKKKKLVVLDFSQIEYRVGAHLAKDETMLDVYNNQGGDLHSETARSVWDLVTEDGKNARDLTLKEVKDHFNSERTAAKAINFGIFYEMGAKSLASTINKGKKPGEKPTTEKEAQEIIFNFKRRFKGVAQFIEWSHQFAEKNGYVKTLTGRKRHLPDASIHPRNQEENIKKSKAMRQSVNSSVQGGSADVMAIAVRNIRRSLIERGWWKHNAMIVNLVHDECSIECDEDIAQEVFDLAKDEMENAVPLRCKILAEGDIADTWFEAK